MTRPIPPRFAHHALAVLGAAMLGATIFSIIFTMALTLLLGDRPVGPDWLSGMAMVVWLGVFVIVLPGAAIPFSLLWPITRRRTAAANWVCLTAGATTGIVLAPFASRGFHGTTAMQLFVFALTGTAVAAAYLIILSRLDGDAKPSLFAKWRRSRGTPEQASFDFG